MAITLAESSKTINGDMYSMETGMLARSAVVFGLYWQCIGFVLVLASLYKLPVRGKGATHTLFWASLVCKACDGRSARA